MALTGLGSIVENLQQGSAWRLQHRFLQVLAVWGTAVGPEVVRHTRPIAIRRQVLEVATAGGTWAHALTFERSRILAKLNAHLEEPLLDLRFSTARWLPEVRSESPPAGKRLPLPKPLRPAPATPLEAFARWEQLRRQQTQQAVKCPRCRRPTTKSDLERWDCCRFCIRADWA